jgi:hypothetical protein
VLCRERKRKIDELRTAVPTTSPAVLDGGAFVPAFFHRPEDG